MEQPASIELVWIQLFVGSSSCLCSVFYRPPDSPQLVLQELYNSFSAISPSTPIFLCGDFNIPHIDWSTTSPTCSDVHATMLCSLIQDHGLEQHVTTTRQMLTASRGEPENACT